MSDSSGGFSFGAPVDHGDDDEPVDAIEVSGEPVSRNEAKNMGLVSFATRRSSRTVSLRRNELPSDLPEELGRKLEAAWSHLKKNEIDDALTLAQEVVFEFPSLVAAKLIIAWCFINRKEYDKALAIMQAIPEGDRSAEVLYYTGLCQSRLGRIKDAIATLKLSRTQSNDTLLRKRANDLLLHLQGEQTVCPVCGKKNLYDSMVDVGNQTVCLNCAKTIGDDDEDDEDEDDEDYDDELENPGGTRKRRRLRPPLSKAELAVRFLFVIFLAVIAAFCVYAMSILTPSYYATFRSYFPESWTFMPRPVDVGNTAPVQATLPQQPSRPPPAPTISFDSHPLSSAIVGVEIRHKAVVDGSQNRQGVYSVAFEPEPDGPYQMDTETGDFVWTPSAEDGGKSFSITFGAIFRNLKVRDQVNEVYVSPGPEFRNIASSQAPVPGEIVHLLSDDLSGDETPNLVLVTGQYWEGEIVAYNRSVDGYYHQISQVSIPGRPAGAGVIAADNERWLAIADNWNSRLRYYALRNGNLAEMAVDVDLPGKPILAGFDRDSSISAIVCRVKDEMRLVAYKQENQLHTLSFGDWQIPAEFVWRKVLVLPASEERPEPSILLLGGDSTNAILLCEKDNPTPTPIKLTVTGIVRDGVLSSDGMVYCLLETDGNMQLYSFRLDRTGKVSSAYAAPSGRAPALGGLATTSFSGSTANDAVFISVQQVGIAFMSATGGLGKAEFWSLPRPALPNGGVVSIADPDAAAQVVFMDMDGELWSIGVRQKGQ